MTHHLVRYNESLTCQTNATFHLPAQSESGLIAWQEQGQSIYLPFNTGTLLPPELNGGVAQRLCNLQRQSFDARRAADSADPLPDRLTSSGKDGRKTEDELTALLIGNE